MKDLRQSSCPWDRKWGRTLNRPSIGSFGWPRHLWAAPRIRLHGCGDSPWEATAQPQARGSLPPQHTRSATGETRAEAYANLLAILALGAGDYQEQFCRLLPMTFSSNPSQEVKGA